MAAGQIIVPGAMPTRDRNGRATVGKLFFYEDGTQTPAPVYTTSALTIELANPVVSDAAGRFPSIWADDAELFTVVWTYDDEETIKTYSGVSAAEDAVLASVALAEAAADEAAADAAQAAADLAAILAIEAAGSTAPAIAGKLDRDGSNVGVFAATLRTNIGAASTSALASSTGATLIGLSPGGTLQGILTNILYSSQFASINAALTAWMTAGGTLVIDRDYTITSVFGASDGVFLSGKSYFLTTQGARTITYNGADVSRVWRFFSDQPASLYIIADLTIDAQNKAASPLHIDFAAVTGANRRQCHIEGVKVRNAKMTVATSTSLGANGIVIRGGFSSLNIINCQAVNISRTAGSGVAGSYGTAGIQYFGDSSTTANAQRIYVADCVADTITSEDTPGGANYQDMDGILLFQYKVGSDDVTAPIIERCVGRECVGRSLKRFSNAYGGVTSEFTVIRSVRGKTTGASDISHQDGSGVIRDCDVYYSGAANTEPSIPVVVSFSVAGDNKGATIERIRINDSTGVAKAAVVSLFSNLTDSFRRQFVISEVTDSGTAPMFVQLGALGGTYDCDVTMRNISCDITSAVAVTDSAMPFLKVRATGFINRGSTVPVVKLVSGAQRLVSWGDWWGDEATIGVTRYVPVWRGNAGFSNGFRGPGGGCVEAPLYGTSEVYGRTPLGKFTIASGATLELPPFGSFESAGGDWIIEVRPVGAVVVRPAIRVCATQGTTVLANVQALAIPAGWAVLSGGAPSGAGTDVEIWKDNTTQAARITNYNASSVSVEVTYNP